MAIACRLAVVFSLWVGITGAQAQSRPSVTSVEVFANSAMLISGTEPERYRLVVYRMDALEQIKQSINQQLPRGMGPEAAKAWAVANKDRIQRQVRPAAAIAAQGISLAHYYRLDRLPAVVINRKSVVYGVTDVSAAIRRYQETRRS